MGMRARSKQHTNHGNKDCQLSLGPTLPLPDLGMRARSKQHTNHGNKDCPSHWVPHCLYQIWEWDQDQTVRSRSKQHTNHGNKDCPSHWVPHCLYPDLGVRSRSKQHTNHGNKDCPSHWVPHCLYQIWEWDQDQNNILIMVTRTVPVIGSHTVSIRSGNESKIKTTY